MNKIKDYNDVMDLSADKTHTLQDVGFINGGKDNYNFDVDDGFPRSRLCGKPSSKQFNSISK